MVATRAQQQIYCTNIRVEIFHQQHEGGQFKVDPEVKLAFSGVGFKWKTLNNDPATGRRSQVMQLTLSKESGAF